MPHAPKSTAPRPSAPTTDAPDLAARPPAARPMRVMATAPGYYDNKRRRTGDVFTIRGAAAFSSKWMQAVSDRTPEKITTGAQVLREQHDLAKSGILAKPTAPDPLGTFVDPIDVD